MKNKLLIIFSLFILSGCAPSSVLNGKPALKEIDGKEAQTALSWIFSDMRVDDGVIKGGIHGMLKPVIIALAGLSIVRIGYNAMIQVTGTSKEQSDISLTSILIQIGTVLGGLALYLLLPKLMENIVKGF